MLINKEGKEVYKGVPGNKIPKKDLECLREILTTETHKDHPFFSIEQRAKEKQ